MDYALTFSMPSNPATEVDPAAEVAALAPWAQNVPLPDGTQTAPDQPEADAAMRRWEQFRDFLPADLSGCTALVIGCNAGLHVLELARRGARVTGVDEYPHFLRQARWAAAKWELADRIDLYRGHVHDLARWHGRHDIVVWLGCLHLLRYPRLALDIVARVTQRCLVLGVPETPPAAAAGAQEDGAETAGLAWSGDAATVEQLLRSSGHEVVAYPAPGLLICQPRARDTTVPPWTQPEFVAATGCMPPGLVRFGDDCGIPLDGIAPLALAARA